MAEISSVHIDIARLAREVYRIPDDIELAKWTRSLVECLVLRDHALNHYGDFLLREVEDYRKKEAERKKKHSKDSALSEDSKDSALSEDSKDSALSALIHSNNHSDIHSSKQSEEKAGVKKFTQPSIQEISEYCKSRGNRIDPQAWLDHYTANGWRVGRNPMKDWKAAVRTWEKNSFGPAAAVSKSENPNLNGNAWAASQIL